MKSSVLATFDLDRTLTTGRSLESSFIYYLLRKRRVTVKGLFASARFFLENFRNDPVTAMKRNKLYLKGRDPALVSCWVDEFIGDAGSGFIAVEGQELVKRHKQMGHVTALVTGSLDILVSPLLDCLGLPFDFVYTTQLEAVEGFYTGRIQGTHFYGEGKAALVSRLASELNANLALSFCYADSESDVEMMSLFGHPVAVNPDWRLRRKSEERGWETLAIG